MSVETKHILECMHFWPIACKLFHYRKDDSDDSDELNDDEWYDAFSVKAEEKIYDDLCSIMSSKVD